MIDVILWFSIAPMGVRVCVLFVYLVSKRSVMEMIVVEQNKGRTNCAEAEENITMGRKLKLKFHKVNIAEPIP